ncbi:MAG: peptidylprolyl isomerase [Bacteroidota bacterium]
MNSIKTTGFALILVAFVFFAGTFTGCDSSKKAQGGETAKNDPALLVFPGKDTVLKSEFEYVYQKNNGGWDAVKSHTRDQYQEYLDLYVNFKRKVLEAERLGLHETESFKTEFEGYRKQLAQPYLVEKDVQEQLIDEAYARSKELVAASHILIMTTPDSPPADTLKAYNRTLELRDSIVNHGKDFDTMAQNYSQDPSAKQNKGFLGYFGVFDMVYPFESGAYGTAVGDVSAPIRSGYGYHLIKVTDRIENAGKKTAAHIIIRVGQQYSAKDENQAQQKIQEIYKQLQDGADWEETCKKYSDDPNTANKGGSLGNGRLIPEMENIKRQLGGGEISEPFKTAFGHHIIKITEVEAVKPLEEARAEIKSRIGRDARSTLSKDRLVDRVKREQNLEMNDANLKQFVDRIVEQKQDASFNRGLWRPNDSIYQDLYALPLYAVGPSGDRYKGTVRNFIDHYLKNRRGFEGATAQEAADKFMQGFIEAEMLAYEERQLPKKYREYRELLKEYRDGILLFSLTEDKVWRKAVEDTVGLQKFYDDNQENFRAGERVKVTEYISEKRDIIDEVERLLAAGKSQGEIDSTVNRTSALNCRIRTQTYEKEKAAKEAVMFGKEPGFRSAIMEYGKAFRLLVLVETVPPGQKTFEEAKSECITQYQNYLEETWLAELKESYPVTVKDPVIDKLFK